MVRRDKKRAEINQAFSESLRNIEAAMTLRFDEISKRMYVNGLLYSWFHSLFLNCARVIRHKLRLERLQELFRRRTAIEARMLASTRNIENAMIWAEKALDSSLKRRLQGLGGHANVREFRGHAPGRRLK